MKKILFLIMSCLLFLGCVQKSYQQTVIYTLRINNIKDIKTVGIRGNDKPLSWDYDTSLETVKKDSLYQLKVTYNTGYKFTEVKFTVNGEYELQNQPNRRVEFYASKFTHYNAVFNEVKK